MDGRVKEVNRVVRGYDKHLFARRQSDGAIHILRNTSNPADPTHLVFCLTDNWNPNGKPRNWGLEVIVARLRAIDLWKDETVVDRLEARAKQVDASNERQLRNDIESFLLDFRRQFARATNDINTGSLDRSSKADPRARIGA